MKYWHGLFSFVLRCEVKCGLWKSVFLLVCYIHEGQSVIHAIILISGSVHCADWHPLTDIPHLAVLLTVHIFLCPDNVVKWTGISQLLSTLAFLVFLHSSMLHVLLRNVQSIPVLKGWHKKGDHIIRNKDIRKEYILSSWGNISRIFFIF